MFNYNCYYSCSNPEDSFDITAHRELTNVNGKPFVKVNAVFGPDPHGTKYVQTFDINEIRSYDRLGMLDANA